MVKVCAKLMPCVYIVSRRAKPPICGSLRLWRLGMTTHTSLYTGPLRQLEAAMLQDGQDFVLRPRQLDAPDLASSEEDRKGFRRLVQQPLGEQVLVVLLGMCNLLYQ